MSFRSAHVIAGVLLAAMPAVSFAADIQPGLWELFVENRVAASPGSDAELLSVKQCLTEQDAQDPSRILGGMANPGATDCAYTEKSFSGNVFRFRMTCAGSFGIQASGEIAYSATSMDGVIISTANLAGRTAEFQGRFAAYRLGGC